jgi:hypothetical protein
MQNGTSPVFRAVGVVSLLGRPESVTLCSLRHPLFSRLFVPTSSCVSATQRQGKQILCSQLHQVQRQEKGDTIAAAMDGGSQLQKILPALQYIVPSLDPDRHKGDSGIHLFYTMLSTCRAEYTFFFVVTEIWIWRGVCLNHLPVCFQLSTVA